MEITYYLTYDLPIPYKDLKIYPVTVKDYMLFNAYSECLTVNKNDIPDAAIISMTNLEYLFYTTTQKDNNLPYLLFFDRLLSLCLKEDKSFENMEESLNRYNYDEKGKPFFVIQEKRYTSEDFDEIKNIMVQQNLIELPDKWVSKQVRDSLNSAKEYKQKISGTKPASLEDYIISICTVTGWTMEYVYSLTIRKFIKSIMRMDNFVHYKIYLTAAMSGMVEFKDKSIIKHWLSSIDENRYEDVSVDLDAIQGKVSLEDAKAREKEKYEN